MFFIKNQKAKKILFLASYFIGSIGTAWSQDYAQVYNSDSIMEKASRLQSEEKYLESIQEFDKIHKSDPNYHLAVYEKALSLDAAGRKEELAQHFATHEQTGIMDRFPMMRVVKGVFLSNQEQYDESLIEFAKAEQVIPHNGNMLFNKALVYIRKNQPQEAIDILIECIKYNPKYYSAHYILGLLLIENGKVAEGAIALMSYLSLAPDGKFAENAIQHLNLKLGQQYNKSSTVRTGTQGDDFSELDMILKNNLSLNSGYKIKAKIDDNISRQMQAILEYAAKHTIKNGNIENFYIPWMKAVADKGLIEEFTYFSLLSHEKLLKQSVKNVESYLVRYNEDFRLKNYWDLFASRKLNILGQDRAVVIRYNDDFPLIISEMKDGNFHGRGISMDKYYNTIGELTFVDNELNGTQKYYYPYTKILKEVSEYKNGNMEGKSVRYFPNGNIAYEQYWKDEKEDGPYKSYYIYGGKKCELNYKNGKYDGVQRCYFPSGKLNYELNYKDDEYHGTNITYNQLGKIIKKETYTNGKRNGEYLIYYNDGTLKSKAMVKDDVPVDTLYNYYPNGTIEDYTVYKDSKPIYNREYNEVGELTEENFYENGKISYAKYYDFYGKYYFQERYKDGALSGLSLVKDGELKDVDLNQDYTIINSAGEPIVSVKVDKATKQKLYSYYHHNGVRTRETTFKDNNKNGIYAGFYANGSLEYKSNNKDGVTHGLYENYNQKGQKTGIRYYNEDEQTGPSIAFYDNGTVSSEVFYDEGDVVGDKYTYWLNKKIKTKETFVNGFILNRVIYDRNGKQTDSFSFANKNGRHSYMSQLEQSDNEYVNGTYHGKLLLKDNTDNTVFIDGNYVEGYANGENKYYFPNGQLRNVENYLIGDRHGMRRTYDLAGNPKAVERYIFDEMDSAFTKYYYNGKISYQQDYVLGVAHGKATFFNLDEKPVIVINYNKNIPVSYAPLNAQGTIGEAIPITKLTKNISSKYPNGKEAFSADLDKLLFSGKLSVYSENGTLLFQSSHKDGLLNGPRISNYADGKPYLRENFVNDNFEDEQVAYDPSGNVIIKMNFRLDEWHGPTEIYKNGKLQKTKIFDTSDLVEVR